MSEKNYCDTTYHLEMAPCVCPHPPRGIIASSMPGYWTDDQGFGFVIYATPQVWRDWIAKLQTALADLERAQRPENDTT